MVVRDSVIFGIPLDPTDPSNNAMAPVSGISQGRDIDFDDREQFIYWIQSTVSYIGKLQKYFVNLPIFAIVLIDCANKMSDGSLLSVKAVASFTV